MTASAVEQKHPQYAEMVPDWKLVRDSHKGERHVKIQKQLYLKGTSGMIAKGLNTNAVSTGALMYEAYLLRAVFPDLIKPAVNALVGVMHREPAEIKLPSGMEPLRENATLHGESLQTLLRKVNEQQLLAGRIGLLADVPTGGSDVLPLIVMYDAETIINWDLSKRPDGRQKLDLVVLDESADERTDRFTWRRLRKHLILEVSTDEQLKDATTGSVPPAPGAGAVYRSQLVIQDVEHGDKEGQNRQTEVTATDKPQATVVPMLGGRTLEEIPFVFIGSIDLSPEPDQVPMLGLAQLSMVIYRGEADYRQSLFMQGQDTLVTMGDLSDAGDPVITKPERIVGAGASIDLAMGADAKYIGVSSQGLREQREALSNDRQRGAELGANLLSSAKAGSGREAAESLKIRVAARTATLMTVVSSGADGLQEILRTIAVWMGLNPEEVEVIPNTDFIEDESAIDDLVSLMTAKSMGAPISQESIHQYMRTKDITELTFEAEKVLVDAEEPLVPLERPGDLNNDPDEEGRLRQEDEAAVAAAERERTGES